MMNELTEKAEATMMKFQTVVEEARKAVVWRPKKDNVRELWACCRKNVYICVSGTPLWLGAPSILRINDAFIVYTGRMCVSVCVYAACVYTHAM